MRTALALVVLCVAACNNSTGLVAVSDDLGAGDATPSLWPRRATVSVRLGQDMKSLRLVDGALSSEPADLSLYQAMVLSLRTPNPASICAKGTFATLAEVPQSDDGCPASYSKTWDQFTYLSASSLHTTSESTTSGVALLVRDRDHTAVYRLRMVGDSYDMTGLSTATFDYEPVQ